MTERLVRTGAELLVSLAAALMPKPLSAWGRAMGAELDSIVHPADALIFALGCLSCGAREGLKYLFTRGRTEMARVSEWLEHPKGTIIKCGIAATLCGVLYMALAGAPPVLPAKNLAALIIGLALVFAITSIARRVKIEPGPVALLLGLALMATNLVGMTVNGATRWVSIGGFGVQPSLILMPALILCFIRAPQRLGGLGVGITAVALAPQPDRGMAGVLCAALLAYCAVRPTLVSLSVAAVALLGFTATIIQPDVQGVSPYVDQIFYSSFEAGPAAGLAVMLGTLILLLPAWLGWRSGGENRINHAIFGAIWISVIAAAALGNYPTPLVGYGASSILGYLIAALAMPPRMASIATDVRQTSIDLPERTHTSLIASAA
jgi:phage shock protein PspC (stress-responsive transcriptional regulator)